MRCCDPLDARRLDFVSSPSHPHVRLSPIGLDSIMLDSEERGIPKSYTRIHHVGAIMSEQAVRTPAPRYNTCMIHHGVYRAEKNRFLRHWGNDVNVNVNVPP